MSNILVIGSCRVYTPCNNLKYLNVHRYPGGMVHTPRQVLQAIGIMNKQIAIKEKDFKDVFSVADMGDGKAGGGGLITANSDLEDLHVNLNEYSKFIIELSSLTDFVTYDNIICHSYKQQLSAPSTVLKYDFETLLDYLNMISNGLGSKPLLFVQHNNFNKFNNLDKYMLGHALATYCSINRSALYLDLLKIIAEHGAEKTLKDENHHTDFMVDRVRSEITDFVRMNDN